MSFAVQLGNRWLTLAEASGDVPALRIQVRAVSRAVVKAAQAALIHVTAGEKITEVSPDVYDQAREAYARGMAGAAIIAWESVGDLDGAPLPVTPENIDMLMDDELSFRAFDDQYVAPYLIRVAEKNASSLSVASSTESGSIRTADNAEKQKDKPAAAST